MKTVKRSKQKGRICSIHLPINCKSYLWFITGSGSAVSACDEESFLLASETVTGSKETTAGEDDEEEGAIETDDEEEGEEKEEDGGGTLLVFTREEAGAGAEAITLLPAAFSKAETR